MPGSLAAATVSPTATVLPYGLNLSFVESQLYPVLDNRYHDGAVQRGLIVDGVTTPRPARIWKLSRRLTTAQLATLSAFWATVQAGLKPFYFYDPYQGTPIGSNWDGTGVSTTGRVKCIFSGSWSQSTLLGRHSSPDLTIVEVL